MVVAGGQSHVDLRNLIHGTGKVWNVLGECLKWLHINRCWRLKFGVDNGPNQNGVICGILYIVHYSTIYIYISRFDHWLSKKVEMMKVGQSADQLEQYVRGWETYAGVSGKMPDKATTFLLNYASNWQEFDWDGPWSHDPFLPSVTAGCLCLWWLQSWMTHWLALDSNLIRSWLVVPTCNQSLTTFYVITPLKSIEKLVCHYVRIVLFPLPSGNLT